MSHTTARPRGTSVSAVPSWETCENQKKAAEQRWCYRYPTPWRGRGVHRCLFLKKKKAPGEGKYRGRPHCGSVMHACASNGGLTGRCCSKNQNTMNEHSCLLVHRDGRGSALQRLDREARFSSSSNPKECW